jgi:2'-5' RNA ligase
MRLFLAINLPEEVRKNLFITGQSFEDYGRMKAVEENNIHLTVKFLGEAESESVIELLKPLDFKTFEISLKGLGAFPSEDYVKVLWAGVSNGFDDMVSLNEKIDSHLPGFKEKKPYHPHATLGRVKSVRDKEGLAEFFDESREKDFGSFMVRSLDLMKSELLIGGPEYEILKTFPLIQ